MKLTNEKNAKIIIHTSSGGPCSANLLKPPLPPRPPPPPRKLPPPPPRPPPSPEIILKYFIL